MPPLSRSMWQVWIQGFLSEKLYFQTDDVVPFVAKIMIN